MTGLVVLTPPRPEDSEPMFRWINDPDTVRFSAAFRAVSRQDHDAWFLGLNEQKDRVFRIIRRDLDGAAIGTVQLVGIDPAHRLAELIIRIGEPSQRDKGLGVEALRLMVAHGFEVLDLHRIWLRVFTNNPRAIRAYEKAGFQHEGVLRQSALIDGQWIDQAVMAILRP